METHLKPSRFDVEPSSPHAAQEWKHWYTTLTNFLTAMKVTDDKDKYHLLINFINPTVFTYISDYQTYPLAIKALQEMYDKPKNVMYSRHLLLTTKQQSNQSLDDFLCVLKNISKDCGYKAVTSEEHRNESILSAFVSGLSSNFIRQRLLESDNLTLGTAFTQARTLDLAQRNAESYQSNSYPQDVVFQVNKDLQNKGILRLLHLDQINSRRDAGFVGESDIPDLSVQPRRAHAPPVVKWDIFQSAATVKQKILRQS